MKDTILKTLWIAVVGLSVLGTSQSKAFFGIDFGRGGFGVGVGAGPYYGYGPYWGHRYYRGGVFPAFGVTIGPRYYRVSDQASLDKAYRELKDRVHELNRKLKKRIRLLNSIKAQRKAMLESLKEDAAVQEKQELRARIALLEAQYAAEKRKVSNARAKADEALRGLKQFESAVNEKLGNDD